MSITKKSSTVFDDDFEVTYEEEIPFTYEFDTKPVTDKTVVIDTAGYKSAAMKRPDGPAGGLSYVSAKRQNTARYEEDYEDGYDEIYEDESNDEPDYESRYERRRDDRLDDDDDYDYSSTPSRRRARRKSSFNGGALMSPVKKTAKYGTKAIYRVARSVVRVVSILITAGTLGVLAYNFWRGAAPYGDPQRILTDKNYALIAYAAVAAVFLLFELISFFWSMTRMRIREGRKVYKEDTGRGLFSFIFIYIASYLSFLLCSFLPETLGTYEILNGAKGALDVFGSLHNVLLGLCLAGVIACLVRRNMN